MSVSPAVVPPNTTAAVAVAASGFTAGESVRLLINGSQVSTHTADANGRLGLRLNSGSAAAYVIVETVGASSGRRAGGVYAVSSSAPAAPGVAVAPHAINPTGSSNITMVGVRYPANTDVEIYRNGVTLMTVKTNASGGFTAEIAVAPTANTSAVYSAGTGQVGSLAGQSVEERSDAGTPPAGDGNPARALTERPVVSTVPNTSLSAVSAEGFQPGEVVKLSCGWSWYTPDATGTVGVFHYFGGGPSQLWTCGWHGDSSQRKASVTFQVDPRAANVPGALNAPGTLLAGGNQFRFMFTGVGPHEKGKVYINGQSQGSLTAGTEGQGSILLTAPTQAGVYAVRFVGDQSGRIAIAPLLVGGLADVTPPQATAPTVTLPEERQIRKGKVPLQLNWMATDVAGIELNELQQSVNGGAWSSIALPSPTATSMALMRAAGRTYRFRVRSTDKRGNRSTWHTGPPLQLIAHQESSSAIRYSSGWTRKSVSKAYGGALSFAKASGARIRFTFTGRQFAWVAPRGPNRGAAHVYVDGVYLVTVNHFPAATLEHRVLVLSHAWSEVGTHTVEIRVLGTDGRPRVDLDAFVILN